MKAAIMFTLVASVSAFAPASVSRVSKKFGVQKVEKHCGALWAATTKNNVYEIFDLSKPATEGGDIFDLGNILLECSDFVYRFQEIRTVVRDHHEGYPKANKFWEFWKAKKQVNFLDPALIIQTDSSNKDHPDRNLKSVITPQAIVEFLNRDNNFNRKFLTLDKSGDIAFDEDESSSDTNFSFLDSFKKYADQNVKILDYDDEFSTSQGGLTYGLVVNLTQKWACVVFRGTVGVKDGFTDFSFELDTKSLIGSEGESGYGEKPGTHKGFTGYLCDPRKNDSDNTRRYIDRIVSSLNFAFDIDAKNPDEEVNVKPKITSDFKLYVTGHSMGGGLANLFSYHLADLKARDDESAKHIPDQITAVTFASPVVGNKPFQEKFNQLEETGFLRHYRIANKGYIVSGLIPPFLGFIPFVTRDCMKYVQNGLSIDLKENGKVAISNDSTPNSFISNGVLSGFNPFKILDLHSVVEYKRRMDAVTGGKK